MLRPALKNTLTHSAQIGIGLLAATTRTMKIVPGTHSAPLNVLEFEEYAKEYLPKNTFDYYVSGADDMVSLRENREAFRRMTLHPRVLRDVSNIDMRTTLLGTEVDTPVCIAPSAMQCMAHPQGERGTARAAARTKAGMILSSLSTTSLEDVAAENGDGLRWFQLYVFKDRDLTRELVERAEKAGYKAIVLTVDTPVLGHREPDVRNRFHLPKHLQLANFAHVGGKHAHGVRSLQDSGLAYYVSKLFDLTLNWKDVEWLKSITKLPLVVKGVLSPEDAKLAVEAGCAGILVSNHGARQLDGVPAAIDALPEIVKAVSGRAEVYLDGGVRRGTDVFKALALGARAVFVGRPVLWGLSHSGEEGVFEVLRILNDELRHTMLFSGTPRLADIRAIMATLTPLKSGLKLKNWVLGDKLGSGACSDVYAVQPEQASKKASDATQYVMKISPIPQIVSKNKKRKKTPAERNADALYAEHLLYQTYLRDHEGIPSIPPSAYGEDQGYRFLVIERLGRTLEDVKKEVGTIASATAARLGIDLLDTLQYIHSKNVVYADVKPENFMLDAHDESKVYCVDFGISDRYIAATGKHKEFKMGAVVGTPTYLSLDCHSGGSPGRKDDVEALLYVLVYMMLGSLPWQKAKNDEEGAKLKKSTLVADLCKSLPSEWSEMITKIRSCKFEDKPDYEYFQKKFLQLGGHLHENVPFKWGANKGHAKGVSPCASPAKKRQRGVKCDAETNVQTDAVSPSPTAKSGSNERRRNARAAEPNKAKDKNASDEDDQSTEGRKRSPRVAVQKNTKDNKTAKKDDESAADDVEFVMAVADDPQRRQKAAAKAVAAAAAATAAAKAASNGTTRYNLRSRT
ncbi:TPA: hypothetical protein N0F65_002133 [Lagenidium giganteum]|uniref:Uncharacterized protein n=1 Tax=Lagenidium giganteum TaxID=4803 RepID=A0AAV2ZDM8_9STRA|nr:TPA: hypothetical protein N0F65_002133 [Lagenidium giganteum]